MRCSSCVSFWRLASRSKIPPQLGQLLCELSQLSSTVALSHDPLALVRDEPSCSVADGSNGTEGQDSVGSPARVPRFAKTVFAHRQEDHSGRRENAASPPPAPARPVRRIR